MRQKLLFVFCLLASFCISGIAQKHSVTNADLELYRQKRLQAERDYRENYERLGFPSPEELARRRDQSQSEMIALSEKLRAERLERERLESARMALAQQAAQVRQYYPVYSDNTIYSGAWVNPAFGFGRHNRGFLRYRRQTPSGYFAGGHFWPPPVGSVRAPAPIIRLGGGRHHR